MEERWLELAFEGHRAYDLFRNNLPMERNYPGTHSLNNTPTTNINQKVLPTDPVLYSLYRKRKLTVIQNLPKILNNQEQADSKWGPSQTNWDGLYLYDNCVKKTTSSIRLTSPVLTSPGIYYFNNQTMMQVMVLPA